MAAARRSVAKWMVEEAPAPFETGALTSEAARTGDAGATCTLPQGIDVCTLARGQPKQVWRISNPAKA